MPEEVRVVLVKPGDILVFGNVGSIGDPTKVRSSIEAIKKLLNIDRIMIFEADIDMALVPRD